MFNLAKRMRKHVGCACWMPGILRRVLLGATGSQFEVERKFSLTTAERKDLPAKLLALGYRFAGQAYMVDTFVPAEVEGDMIRVRRETMNDRTKVLLTRKTWEQVGGERERKEHEEEISPLVEATLLDVGRRLKGGDLLSFSKERDFYTRTIDGRKVTVSIDTVDGLGEYSGLYMEIELLISRKCDVKAARESIKQVLKDVLGDEREFVQMSYMEMLKRTASSRG